MKNFELIFIWIMSCFLPYFVQIAVFYVFVFYGEGGANPVGILISTLNDPTHGFVW